MCDRGNGLGRIRSTTRLITDRFVWENIRRDVRQWVKNCLSCQASRVHKHTQSPLARFLSLKPAFDISTLILSVPSHHQTPSRSPFRQLSPFVHSHSHRMYPETDLGVYARMSLPSTHTGLQNSELWRRFNRQAETSRPASTPPEDIRPFPWTPAFKHTCYNRLSFRLETLSTGKNLHIWSLLPKLHPSLEHNCLVLRSNRLKDTVPPSSQPLQPFSDDSSNRLVPIPVPPLLETGSHS
nr:gag pol polyprotein [Hymenolepis microstoma]